MLTLEDKKYIKDRIGKKIDNLAVLIQKSFAQVSLRADMEAIEVRMNDRFDKIDYRLDVIEYKIIGGQGRRLEKIEDDMRVVKTKLDLQ